jgi:GT2 family glycosyltransferase
MRSLAFEPILDKLPFRSHIIYNEKNRGFGAACNQGADLCVSKYLLFLNPDAALYGDTLSKALSFMRNPENANIGICGVQLLDESGDPSRSCARFPSALGLVGSSVGVDRFFPRLGHVMAEWDHVDANQVDHVIGAFFLVRYEVFEVLGGFDERFFVYLEDLDFSYRARKLGWLSIYLADIQAFHVGGGTSNQVKALRLFYSQRSRLVYAFKHFKFSGAFAVLAATLFVEPISRSVFALKSRSWTMFKELWVAYVLLWRWLPGFFYGKK